MPICKKCNTRFPNLNLVDGVKKNFSTRKYCISCSPFRSKNTGFPRDPGQAYVCLTCTKPFDYSRSRGHRRDACNSCISKKQRVRIKTRCLQYKGSVCQGCGYDKCIEALVFHHLDTSQKEFNIGGSHNRSWKIVQKELDKCVLLCHNCHTEVHAGVRIL